MGVPPNRWFIMEQKIPLKWVIGGYPYFRKPPACLTIQQAMFLKTTSSQHPRNEEHTFYGMGLAGDLARTWASKKAKVDGSKSPNSEQREVLIQLAKKKESVERYDH